MIMRDISTMQKSGRGNLLPVQLEKNDQRD
jgi:hypothetical protein